MSLLRESASGRERKKDRVKEKEKPQPVLTLPTLNHHITNASDGADTAITKMAQIKTRDMP